MLGILEHKAANPAGDKTHNKSSHWYVVMTVCIGAFMAALDASIINIALPKLQRTFQVSMGGVEWVSLVYLLTLASSIVLFGKLADMKGRSRMYTIGFILFGLSSLSCGLAFSFWFLLFMRVLQAIGAAMLQANSVSIITAVTPDTSRGKAIGIQASAQGIGLTLGPPIGGALLTYINWRWLFLVNVPVSLIGITLAYIFLPRDSKHKRVGQFDILGAVCLTGTLVALTYLINQLTNPRMPILSMALLLVVVAAGLALFIRTEKRAASPVLDLSLFRIQAFTLGNVTGIISYTVMYAVLFLAPYMMEHLFDWTTFTSGLILTSIPLGMTIITPLAGAIADKYGLRAPATIGMLAAMIGCIGIAAVKIGTGFYSGLLIVGLFLVGLGLGLFTPPNNSGVMGAVPRTHLGVAGGFLNMSRTIGMNFGIAVGGLTYTLLETFMHNLNDGQAYAFHVSYLFFALLALINTALALINANRKRDPDYFFGDGI